MSNRLVLIVEDDVDLATTLAEALEVDGFPSAVAFDGREGLAVLREQTPRLILLDLMMPAMDGWQFRKEQLKDPRLAAIPVIVMTARGHAAETAKELGASGFLDKPVALERLFGEVSRVAR